MNKLEDLKDEQVFNINGATYTYCEFYKRLERSVIREDGHWSKNITGSRSHPAIACPICYANQFSIVYGDYECIADCDCGHSMVIYDG